MSTRPKPQNPLRGLSTDDESLPAFKFGGYLLGGGEPRSMWVGKEMLARVFELGHHRIRLGDNFAPVSAEGPRSGFYGFGLCLILIINEI